jgi:hypothetical protein
MEQELVSVENNKTWELVELPSGHRPITLKRDALEEIHL